MANYDISEAFEVIEDELISSMMRNLSHHRIDEISQGMEWEQWQVLQLQALEEYRQRNQKKFPPRFNKLNGQIANALHTSYQSGATSQERQILQAIQNGYKPPVQTFSGQTEITGEFFKTNDRKLNALVNATVSDMSKAEYSILRHTDDQYRQIIFNAQVYANTGAGTYEKAVDMATKDFLKAGINSIQYKNGSRHTIEEYSRMALQTAMKRAYLQGEGEKRKEFGIPTVILKKRTCACPKCLPFVGKVFIDDVWSGGDSSGISPVTGIKYPLLSQAISLGLYHPNCRDTHSTYYEGISTPPEDSTYTVEELDEIAETYKAEQQQSYCENQADRYHRLSKYSLDSDNKRMYGARATAWDNKAKQYKNLLRMGNNTQTDLSIAKPIKHTAEEYAELADYAQNSGIKVYNVEKFDGDIEIAKEQIDALKEIRDEYKLNSSLTISFGTVVNGLGETSHTGGSIVFNNCALRDRKLTNKYLNEDDELAANDVKGIAYHESGHLISLKYGEKGFDIAKKAYYNIYKKDISNLELLDFLQEKISRYSRFLPEDKEDKPFKAKFYKEITPEILSKDKTNPNEFTREFVRLLKEAYGL